MKKTLLLSSAVMFGVVFLAANVNAQGVPQTVEITKVDVQKVSAGYRASKVIGSSIVNDANETIGKIDIRSKTAGIALWPAVILHATMAVWCVTLLLRKASATALNLIVTLSLNYLVNSAFVVKKMIARLNMSLVAWAFISAANSDSPGRV